MRPRYVPWIIQKVNPTLKGIQAYSSFPESCYNTRNRIWPSISWQAHRRFPYSQRQTRLANLLRAVLGTMTNSIVAEDNMNVQLKDITVTARDGRVSHLDQVYIRGSHVRFFIVPDMLRYDLSWRRYCNDLFLGVEKWPANEPQKCTHV